MTRPQFIIALAAISLAAAGVNAQQPVSIVPEIPGLPAAARAAAASIDPEKIRAHVRFLSLDLLEGRGPGTRGAELAAEYIATQFALTGVEPAGDNGTYFQHVPLVAVHTIEDKTHFSFVPSHGDPVPLAYGTEIVSKDETGQPIADFDAPIVFVGYGIHAPEYHWNDYALPNGQDVDLHGKIALIIVNEPPSDDASFFKGKALTYYGRWTYKYEEAARRGAIGVLIIHRTDLASYGWEVVRNSQAIEKSYLQGDPDATLRAAAWIQHDVAQRLFTLSGLGDLDQAIDRAGKPGAFHAIELPVRLHAHIESRVRRYVSSNVVGRVSGVSAKNQAVLYTAHYDHLGIDPDVPDPKFPFLGVHFTRLIHGGVEAGPNAVLAFAREGYRNTDFSLRDMIETLTYRGFWRFLLRYPSMCWDEFKRSYSKSLFCLSLQRLAPELQIDDLAPGGAESEHKHFPLRASWCRTFTSSVKHALCTY